jgi:hypothetical protein
MLASSLPRMVSAFHAPPCTVQTPSFLLIDITLLVLYYQKASFVMISRCMVQDPQVKNIFTILFGGSQCTRKKNALCCFSLLLFPIHTYALDNFNNL